MPRYQHWACSRTGSFIFDDDIADIGQAIKLRLQFISLSSFILGVISAPKVRRAKWQLGNAQQKAVL